MAKLGKFQTRICTVGGNMDTKIVITRIPGHPPEPEFAQNHPTISPKVLPCPKGVKINVIKRFLKALGG